MNELTLPFIGNLNLWPWLIAAVVLLLVWDHLPAIAIFAFKKIGSLVASLISNAVSGVKKEVAAVVAPAPAVETPLGDSLTALQSLTVWAVHEGTPEVLGKVTALYGDLQKQIKETKSNPFC